MGSIPEPLHRLHVVLSGFFSLCTSSVLEGRGDIGGVSGGGGSYVGSDGGADGSLGGGGSYDGFDGGAGMSLGGGGSYDGFDGGGGRLLGGGGGSGVLDFCFS